MTTVTTTQTLAELKVSAGDRRCLLGGNVTKRRSEAQNPPSRQSERATVSFW